MSRCNISLMIGPEIRDDAAATELAAAVKSDAFAAGTTTLLAADGPSVASAIGHRPSATSAPLSIEDASPSFCIKAGSFRFPKWIVGR